MSWTVAEPYGLDDVLTALGADRLVYALERAQDGEYRLVSAESWIRGQHTLGTYRPTQPLKSLFFRPRENLGPWDEPPPLGAQPDRIVFGVKNCDLSALAIYDHVFLEGGYRDPYYAEAREKTILVTTDCTGCLDVCFCPAVGEQPFPVQGYDINFSPTPLGAVIEGGSERGDAVLNGIREFLCPAGEDLIAAREGRRAELFAEVSENATSHGLTPGADLRAAVEGAFESDLWEDFAEDCVECGACNFICCTCHCFLLSDGHDRDGATARTRQWDSCLLANFARTAGGGNPRHRRAQRLRNRFDKKLSYFPQVLGRYACDGCGRCTEACIGKIDIRHVLKRAIDDSHALHAGTGDD